MTAKNSPPIHNLPPIVRKTSPFHRFALLTILLALPIALFALAACGGGNNGGNGASNSTATSGAPAITPDAPAATQPPAPAEAVPAAGSGTEKLFVLALNYETMELNLTAGDTARIAYSSFGRSSGGITDTDERSETGAGSAEGDVILTVLNPVEDQVLNEEQTDNNTVEFHAELSGVYQLVFSNPYRLQGIDVTVEYAINP